MPGRQLVRYHRRGHLIALGLSLRGQLFGRDTSRGCLDALRLRVLLSLSLGGGEPLGFLVGLLLLEGALGLGGKGHLAQLVLVVSLTHVLVLNAPQVL